MMGFFKENLTVIAVAAAVVIFLIRFGRAIASHLRLSRQIDREGHEADAVVSRVVCDYDPDSGDSRITYVAYTDDTGAQRESPLAAAITDEYERGDWLRIKFLPGEYDMVKPIRKR